MITRQNFKNLVKENVWHRPSFLINDSKFNETVMQPEILLESDIEIQNQSNVCLTFRNTEKINLTNVVNIKKFSSLLKLTLIIVFLCRFLDNLKLWKSNTLNKIQVNPIFQPSELSIAYKKTDEWYIKWQRMTSNDNEWQRVVKRVTTNDNEW